MRQISHPLLLYALANERRECYELTKSVARARADLATGHDRQPLVQTLALGAVKQGNDPHNQAIDLCLLEDYQHSMAADREQLLLACAQYRRTCEVRGFIGSLSPLCQSF